MLLSFFTYHYFVAFLSYLSLLCCSPFPLLLLSILLLSFFSCYFVAFLFYLSLLCCFTLHLLLLCCFPFPCKNFQIMAAFFYFVCFTLFSNLNVDTSPGDIIQLIHIYEWYHVYANDLQIFVSSNVNVKFIASSHRIKIAVSGFKLL